MSMIPSFVSSSSPHSMLDMISKNTHSFSVVQEINAQLTNHHQHDLLFEKVLTPSDVGKLNRLVIPKQYAEKYFPLHTAGSSSSSSGEALLSFEDDIGKIWKFRYSYWTSSQSYVLTKGWSRYVKDKGLTAGDIVSFQRLSERLFIAWRTREHGTGTVHRIKYANTDHYQSKTTAVFPAPQPNFPSHPTISSTPRRLRLFGVNMEFNDQSKSSNASTNVLTLNQGSSSHQFNLEECMIKHEFQPAW